MGMVKTHHEKYFVKPEPAARETFQGIRGREMMPLISGILRESPAIVADVAAGKLKKEILEKIVVREVDRQHGDYEGMDRDAVVRGTLDYLFGYGPLQRYVDDERISDIDGTAYDEFSVKADGIRRPAPIDFGSEQEFDTFCKLMAVRNNGILNENDSHCRVTDEGNRLRINLSIRPRNVSGPSISIRKHRKVSYTLDDLEGLGMMDGTVKEILTEAAREGKSMIISGKGASGKTTLLRAVIDRMPEMERVLVCESDSEIYPEKKYCIQQRVKKPNEGGAQVSLADLVRDGLTMSLDTYVIGETVGPEAMTFLRAVHSGHRGMTTTHAVNAREALTRMITLASGAEDADGEGNLRSMLGSTIDLVVHMKDFKVSEVCGLNGYDERNGCFRFRNLLDAERKEVTVH
jgi:pilus assembly protein CpaF